jgi:hypothetical protein
MLYCPFSSRLYSGVIFVKDSLLLTIYPDVTVSALTPKLLDRRTLGPTQITLVRLGAFECAGVYMGLNVCVCPSVCVCM